MWIAVRLAASLLTVGLLLVAAVHALGHGSLWLAGMQWHGIEAPSQQREPVEVSRIVDLAIDREQFQEAPSLGVRVEAGALPPVHERVPAEPLVIEPAQQAGPYGGTWRRVATSVSDLIPNHGGIAGEPLLSFTPDYRGFLPNVAKDWQVSDDARQYTLHLREGMRWSDGEPFSAEDIRFWREHVVDHPDLSLAPPAGIRHHGELPDVEVIDQHTVRLTYSVPHPSFLYSLAHNAGKEMVSFPAHYLRLYHADTADPEQLEQRVRAYGYENWFSLFESLLEHNPAKPGLGPWLLSQRPQRSPVMYRRNPYYWKLDHQGRQLPYIDAVAYDIAPQELIPLKVLAGDLGMQGRHISLDRYSFFKANQARGNYRILEWIDPASSSTLAPNLTHAEPAMAELMQDKRFRAALSYAIDRHRINEVVYYGLGRPGQLAPPPVSPFYREEYVRHHLEHDPDRANQLLDAIGLDRRNRHGVRLTPDGRPVAVTIDNFDLIGNIDALQLIAADWRDVGIEADVRQLGRSLFYTRMDARTHDVAVVGNNAILLPMLTTDYVVPSSPHARGARTWAAWYLSDGQSGERPPERIRRNMHLFDQAMSAPTMQEHHELFHELFRRNAEDLWMIGILTDLPGLVVVSDRFRNVPDSGVMFGGILTLHPWSFAIDQR